VLFTVVSRDEKYSAKLVIDTVVQRLGDALAAAAFQILGEHGLLLY
jgi:AAA family ATP:ADP antiporter